MRTTIMLYHYDVSLYWENENLYSFISSKPSDRLGRAGDDGGGDRFLGGVMKP